MKTAYFTLIACFSLFLFASCEKDNDELSNTNSSLSVVEHHKSGLNSKSSTTYTDIPISSWYQSANYGNTTIASTVHIVDIRITENGDDTDGSMKVILADSDESIIGLEMSDNILANTSITYDFWTSHPDPESQDKKNQHASCIADCHDTFTDDDGNKIKGRGGCKAHCWVDSAARLVSAVVTILG